MKIGVADVRDVTSPQIGRVEVSGFGVERSLERGGGRSGAFTIDGAFDDRSDDGSLILAAWDAAKGTESVPDEAARIAYSGRSAVGFDLRFRVSEDADEGCLPSNFQFGPPGSKKTYAVALIDMAGNASDVRTVETEVGKETPAGPLTPVVDIRPRPSVLQKLIQSPWSLVALGAVVALVVVLQLRRRKRSAG